MRMKGFEPSQALSQQILSLSRLTTPAHPHFTAEWENSFDPNDFANLIHKRERGREIPAHPHFSMEGKTCFKFSNTP